MKRMLLGVGNRLGGDDGVGPQVAQMLLGSVWHVVDCGTSIENAAGLVARERPDLLVVVDAARMGLPPGSVRRMPLAFHDRMLASTHGLPLGFVIDRIRGHVGEAVLVGIEPESVAFGEELSSSVSAAAGYVAEHLRRLDLAPIPEFQAADSAGDR